jgi:hypothetical protein
MSYNPGHTQAAVHHASHPTNQSELTSAVMAGEGSKAGHGAEGAGDGSRGGAGAVVWEARALAVISKGMSSGSAHPHGGVTPNNGEMTEKVSGCLSFDVLY